MIIRLAGLNNRITRITVYFHDNHTSAISLASIAVLRQKGTIKSFKLQHTTSVRRSILTPRDLDVHTADIAQNQERDPRMSYSYMKANLQSHTSESKTHSRARPQDMR